MYHNHWVRRQLESDGYVVLQNFFIPAECDELIEASQELTKDLPDVSMRTVFSTTGNMHQRATYFIESNDKIRTFFEEKALDSEGTLLVEPEISLNKVGHALHLLHPLFRCYTYCSRVKDTCQQLGLKEPAVVQSMMIYKNPGVGGEVKPHQDITYLHTSPIPPVGFWIALEDANTKNGCLWIAKGSHMSGVHRRMIRNPDKTSENILIYDRPSPIYPRSSFTPVCVEKGSCIILHGQVVHMSLENKSKKPRPAYTFHVIEQKNNQYSPDNWLQQGPNAPFQNLYDTKQLIYKPTCHEEV